MDKLHEIRQNIAAHFDSPAAAAAPASPSCSSSCSPRGACGPVRAVRLSCTSPAGLGAALAMLGELHVEFFRQRRGLSVLPLRPDLTAAANFIQAPRPPAPPAAAAAAAARSGGEEGGDEEDEAGGGDTAALRWHLRQLLAAITAAPSSTAAATTTTTSSPSSACGNGGTHGRGADSGCEVSGGGLHGQWRVRHRLALNRSVGRMVGLDEYGDAEEAQLRGGRRREVGALVPHVFGALSFSRHGEVLPELLVLECAFEQPSVLLL
ncbi:hypothetical protein Agub_g1071 [Astrephomene gubernaculifera]|uniref:Uncharacterized protein n=1 Tax=Astrephomene gubernaculifera TaxID=47775 RepID=A0AAD3DGT6_9CHLO|nr:hypothetical protein Agub_g1071 [Astrephomene gubernaculifera]